MKLANIIFFLFLSMAIEKIIEGNVRAPVLQSSLPISSLNDLKIFHTLYEKKAMANTFLLIKTG